MNGALSKEIEKQQNELELKLELDGDFFGRKLKCLGEGISGWGPPWAHETGGASYRGAPSSLVAWCLPLLQCFHCLKSSNIPEKIILNL